MNLSTIANTRYTTKAFDADKKIASPIIEELLALMRQAPSSVNSQPWHFVLASDSAGKARIAKGMEGGYTYNLPKVQNASHVIVLCSRTDMDPVHLQAVLDQEGADGRFVTDNAREGQQATRMMYVNMHRFDQKDLQAWMEKQTYLALGTLLLGAAALGVDATPMEGFDALKLDEALGLRAKGFTSVVVVSLGYRSENDFNAKLPKSRLPESAVVTRL